MSDGVNVSRREKPDDAVGVRIVRPNEHVEICRVVGDLRLSAKAGFRAFGRLPLSEACNYRSSVPHRIVVLAVDHGLNVHADRDCD